MEWESTRDLGTKWGGSIPLGFEGQFWEQYDLREMRYTDRGARRWPGGERGVLLPMGPEPEDDQQAISIIWGFVGYLHVNSEDPMSRKAAHT